MSLVISRKCHKGLRNITRSRTRQKGMVKGDNSCDDCPSDLELSEEPCQILLKDPCHALKLIILGPPIMEEMPPVKIFWPCNLNLNIRRLREFCIGRDHFERQQWLSENCRRLFGGWLRKTRDHQVHSYGPAAGMHRQKQLRKMLPKIYKTSNPGRHSHQCLQMSKLGHMTQ